MAKLIYAEPDEEITNLVDRLRAEKAEADLVFVLPPASRVMQSGLNARLLMQYSNSLGKRTSVVSPDPRSQGTAIETGFTVYPNLSDYEARRAIDHAVEPITPLPPVAEDPGVFDEAPPPPLTPRPTEAPAAVPTPRPRPVAARTQAKTGKKSRLPWVLGIVGVLVIALLLLLFVAPSATVTIITAARSVSATPTVTGSTNASGGGGNQLALQTTVQQAQESTSQTRNSTGKKDVPAVPATGQVKFTNNGSTCVDFPAGTGVSTDTGVLFVTQAESGFLGPSNCPNVVGTTSKGISVQAKSGGASTNVPAGSLTHIQGTNDADYHVTNDQPTGNGADPTQKTVVSQVDLDQAKKELGDQLTQKVKDDIKQKGGGQKVIDETQTITVDANFDHKAGDEAGNFNANVGAKGQATTFDESKMKQVLTDALKRQAPSGYRLTDDAPKLDYHVAQKDANGNVTWDASAAAFMAVAVDNDNLKKNITGQSPAKARSYVLGHIDANDVVIKQSPSFIPWLPFISGRIDIKEQVQNNTPQ